MLEKNTYRFVSALMVSVLVHVSILFYMAKENNAPADEVNNSVVIKIEMVAGNVKSLGKKLRYNNKNKIKINRKTAIEREETVERIKNKSVDEFKKENKKDIQMDLIKDGVEKNQEVAASNDGKPDELLKLVYIEINKNKYYPYQARRQYREGKVKINFKLHPDGRVSEIMILESSHFSSLDRAAKKAVESISPFLIASNYLHAETEFNVDIDYQLN